MGKNQKETDSFEVTLQKRNEIQDRIDGIKNSLSVMPNLRALRIVAGDARTRLTSFVQQNSDSDGRLPERHIGMRNLYKEKLETSLAKYNDAKEKDGTLRAELDELKKELSDLVCACSKNELRGIQSALTQLQKEEEEIKQAIAEQEETSEQGAAMISSIKRTPATRTEDYLAKNALGLLKDVDKQVNGIDELVIKKNREDAKGKDNAYSAMAKANMTIAGLKRMLDETSNNAERLSKILPKAKASFLLSRAEHVGVEYLEAAHELMTKYNQLVALGKLIQNTEPAGPENQGWNMFRNIEIPIFPIKAFQDFNWPMEGVPEGEEAMEAELQTLQALGIQL